MSHVAIIAIVAMLLAFLVARDAPTSSAVAVHTDQTAEVILYIDPPPVRIIDPNMPLPDRNPKR